MQFARLAVSFENRLPQPLLWFSSEQKKSVINHVQISQIIIISFSPGPSEAGAPKPWQRGVDPAVHRGGSKDQYRAGGQTSVERDERCSVEKNGHQSECEMGNKKSMLRDRFSTIYEIHSELYKRVVKRIGRKINELIVMFLRSAIIDWGLAVVINEQLLNRTKLKVVGSNPTGRRKFSRLIRT